MRDTADAPSEALRRAFAMVSTQRSAWPNADLTALIEVAAEQCGLSSAQRAWMRWTLDPSSSAVQPKEPGVAR